MDFRPVGIFYFCQPIARIGIFFDTPGGVCHLCNIAITLLSKCNGFARAVFYRENAFFICREGQGDCIAVCIKHFYQIPICIKHQRIVIFICNFIFFICTGRLDGKLQLQAVFIIILCLAVFCFFIKIMVCSVSVCIDVRVGSSCVPCQAKL